MLNKADLSPADNGWGLGDDEVRHLFEMAQQKSRAGRSALFRTITDMFDRRLDELTRTERDLMLEILRRLVLEVEVTVRVQLARQLAQRDDAPHDLLMMLANDDIQVAYDVLVKSPVLRDADLIEVIRQRSQQHQLAVAIRRDISEEVSTALVETGDEDVIVELLNNQSAAIANATMAYLVDEARRVDRFQQPLVRRTDLPPELAKKMLAWVSAALRQYILEHHDIDEHDLDDDINGAMCEAADEIDTLSQEPAPAEKLIDKLAAGGELTPTFLVKSLSQGQIQIFELALARLTRIRPVLLRRIIYEPGGEGLATACRAVGIDRAAFMTIYRLSRRARQNAGDVPPQETNQLMAFYESVSPDSARLLMRKWHRNRNYLEAVHELERAS